MREIEYTNEFKRDFKRESKGRYRSILNTVLKQIIESLANDLPLATKYRDHALTGNLKNYRDCHVCPDLILIYRLVGQNAEEPASLILTRLGSHSELEL